MKSVQRFKRSKGKIDAGNFDVSGILETSKGILAFRGQETLRSLRARLRGDIQPHSSLVKVYGLAVVQSSKVQVFNAVLQRVQIVQPFNRCAPFKTFKSGLPSKIQGSKFFKVCTRPPRLSAMGFRGYLLHSAIVPCQGGCHNEEQLAAVFQKVSEGYIAFVDECALEDARSNLQEAVQPVLAPLSQLASK
jgi:hypothetical protein